MTLRKFGAASATTLVLASGGILGADQAQNPYDDKGTHYELDIKAEIEQGERVEIAKDKAAMTLKGWNDEYAITITPQIPAIPVFGADKAIDRPFVSDGNRSLLSKKMEYRSGDVTAFIEPRATSTEFDIDFTLHAKPETNVFEYKIEGAEDFDFFYQPALTEEEIADGAERPENVIGSFAVYHKTKANHRIGSTNYATGKAFHIYRPKAIDALGAEQWCELSYADGTLSVTCDEKWLETAAYPVVVDPTFGNTYVGGSLYAETDSDLTGSVFTAPINMTLASTTAWVQNQGTASAIKGVIVNTSLSIISNAVTNPSPDSPSNNTNALSADFSTPPSLTAGNDYYITITSEDVAFNVRYDVGVSNQQLVDSTNSYTTPTDPTDASFLDNNLSIYATYVSGCDPSLSVCIDTFTSSENWVAPSGVTSADVACWGGGGAGDVVGGSGGGGGGGGAFASSTVAVTPSTSYLVTIGDGGTGGATPGAGGDSTFTGDDKTVLADGGTPGSAENNGTGGTTANSTGDVEFAGGNGGDGSTTGDIGGGGGGAAGPHGAGGTGAGGAAGVGGGGGGGNGGSNGSSFNGGSSTNGGPGGTGDVNGSFDPPGGDGVSNEYGGGGGGGGDDGDNGGLGGFPGGGGGGGEVVGFVFPFSSSGAPGLCTITYTAAGGGGGTAPEDDTYFEILSSLILFQIAFALPRPRNGLI